MKTIKFKQDLKQYGYILGFDLATHVTGWSLIKVETFKPGDVKLVLIDSGVIDTDKDNGSQEFKDGNKWSDMYNRFFDVITNCAFKAHFNDSKLLVIKERLPNQAGVASTIATLQSLAQTHAIFDMACEKSGQDIYDEDGIHSISVKAYFKGVTGFEKPTKSDIRNWVHVLVKNTPVDIDLNISDSMAVTATLLFKRWNTDLDEERKRLKREIKKYKSAKRIEELQNQIIRIEALKV